MSVGPLGNTTALSGTSQELSNQTRRVASDQRAELAAALGEMDADRETSDRDADGRRPWEFRGPKAAVDEELADPAAQPSTAEVLLQSKDPSGDSGALLDLLG